MAIVTMPKAGQTMEEGTILHWRKQEGDSVVQGEILLEIDTDKAAVEVDSPQSGVLRKILCPEGTTVPVLAPIAILARAKEDISGELARAEKELQQALAALAAPGPSAIPASPELMEPSVPPSALAAPVGEIGMGEPAADAQGRLRASPAARKVAREIGVELGIVAAGSGPQGRILSSDVVRAAETRPRGVPARRPLAGMRKAIARSMLAAKQNIPHFYMKLTIDAGPLYRFYLEEKSKYPCTINDILTLACARVIREFPAFRSRLEQDEVVEFPAASVGVAVGMDEGLVVPVLVGADAMSLRQVGEETLRIIEAAKQGKVVAMGQGVFTLSNLGGFGVEEFSAIINPPEASILAVGAIREAVVVKDEALRPARVMTMVLSADHRLIDGLMAARFLQRLRQVLEAPESLLAPVADQ